MKSKYLFNNDVTIHPVETYLDALAADYDEIPVTEIMGHLAKFQAPTIPFPGDFWVEDEDKTKFFTWLHKLILTSNIPVDLIEYEDKALAKWVGPQGGTVNSADLLPVISLYYERAALVGNFDGYPVIPREVEITLRAMCKGVTLADLRPADTQQLWNAYKGDHRSNSGFTLWKDRRIKSVRIAALAQARKYPLRYDPVVAGSRPQRRKIRSIFMDSFANQFRATIS